MGTWSEELSSRCRAAMVKERKVKEQRKRRRGGEQEEEGGVVDEGFSEGDGLLAFPGGESDDEGENETEGFKVRARALSRLLARRERTRPWMRWL